MKRATSATVGLGLTACIVLSACSQPPKLTDAEICDQLDQVLRAENVGWPVGNYDLTAAQATSILNGFTEAASRSTGDLHTVLNSWNKGFAIASTFLITKDQSGYDAATTETQREILMLANFQLTNTCNLQGIKGDGIK